MQVKLKKRTPIERKWHEKDDVVEVPPELGKALVEQGYGTEAPAKPSETRTETAVEPATTETASITPKTGRTRRRL